MTIASHCVDLLRGNGPMTREELGESCRVARVTAAKDPALAVQGALAYDGRVLRVDGRYYLVERLLEGRWLTLEGPDDPTWFDPDIDLHCLDGLAHKGGVPLASGGRLTRSTYDGGWRGPAGWASPGGVVGLRLVAGVAHVSSVDIDDDVRQRGEQLVARLEERSGSTGYDGSRRHHVATAVLRLLHEDDDLLRQPVPPLRRLFPPPAPEARRYGPLGSFDTMTLRVSLPPQVYAELADAADEAGVPVDIWVAEELARLHAWPRPPWLDDSDRFTQGWGGDRDEPDWWARTGVRPIRPMR
jgi:hypothetical protein